MSSNEIIHLFNSPFLPVPIFRYVGRKPSASTATGDKKLHVVEQNSVVEAALA